MSTGKTPYSQSIDGLPVQLRSPYDFSFLSSYGRVFRVFDQQDSGNLCFGIERDGAKFLIKYAGAPTVHYNGTPEEAVERLKSTLPIYHALRHPTLVELVEPLEIPSGFAMIFKWADGDCMGQADAAAHKRFMTLPTEVRLNIFRDVLDFLAFVNKRGWVAIDFYDGSILYNFKTGKTTVCDIDLFRRMPCTNDMGRMYGSSKFMSPEEFELGAPLDERTNVYTAGALAFALFGGYERTRHKWTLGKASFEVAAKATSDHRNARWQSIRQLITEWAAAL